MSTVKPRNGEDLHGDLHRAVAGIYIEEVGIY